MLVFGTSGRKAQRPGTCQFATAAAKIGLSAAMVCLLSGWG
jgi:hypothetical protein